MDIITLIIGILLIVVKEINLTKTRVLRRPGTIYAGATIIALTVIDQLLRSFISGDSLWISTVVLFAVIFAVVIGLSAPQVASQQEAGASATIPSAGNRMVNIIMWSLIGLFVVALCYFGISYYLREREQQAQLSALMSAVPAPTTFVQ